MLEELQVIADSLAARLKRSVAIDDPQIRLLVHTSHDAETVDRHRVESIMRKAGGTEVVDWVLTHGVATARKPVRIPANDSIEAIARICVPVRCQGVLLAYLWLLDADESVTDAALETATDAAGAAAEVLFRERLLGDIRRSRERELLRDLLASDRVVRAHAAHQLVGMDLLPEGARVAVLALSVEPAAHPNTDLVVDLALRRTARRVAPLSAISTARGGTGGILLVAGRQAPRPDRLRTIAEQLRAEVEAQIGPDTTVRVGVGPVVGSIDMASESHQHARSALRVAAQVPGFAAVAPWDDLGIYRLLVQLPVDQLGADAIPVGLRRLFESDDSGVLVTTLEVYLDAAGKAPATVERLQIHRTSLYYRFKRIEQLTGMSLDNGGDRLALHLGVKFARLTGLIPGPSIAGRTPDGSDA